MAVSTDLIKQLRAETGARVMDCKQALDKAKGNLALAKTYVEEKGLARAEKTADRETKFGYIATYTHNTGTVAAMVELLCETDFVAANSQFQTLARDLAMQVAAMDPADKAALLAQDFIKDSSKTVETVIKSLSGKIGEKMELARFKRLAINQ